jgi:hypothetical protein
MLNNIYQNTNLNDISSLNQSYVDFSSDYFRFAPMPTQTTYDTGNYVNAMGFMGLQTDVSNTLSTYQSVKDTLFTHFNTAYNKDPSSSLYGKGTLYNFASRDELLNYIGKKQSDDGPMLIAQFIDKQTGLFSSVVNEMNQAATTSEAYDILERAVRDRSPDSIIKDQFFEGYNMNGGGTPYSEPPTLELRGNIDDGPVIQDSNTIL